MMIDSAYSYDTIRLAIVVGVVLSMLFYERFQQTAGGAIVPGYLAIGLSSPLAVVSTLAAGYLTYLAISVAAAKKWILYGRRKFELEVLTGLVIIGLASIAASIFGQWDPAYLALGGIGFLVPGIIAHDIGRQGVRRTFTAVAILSVLVLVVIAVFSSLLQIAPGASAPPVLDFGTITAFPRELLIVAVALSVLVGMFVFSRLGLRSGGFITGAYIALISPRWPDILFAVVVGVITWFVVVKILMPRLLIFGRRKLATMLLVGAMVGWTVEILLSAISHGEFLPWRGMTVATLMIPALLANDAQRQGWERTFWGVGLTATGTLAGTQIIAAIAIATGVIG